MTIPQTIINMSLFKVFKIKYYICFKSSMLNMKYILIVCTILVAASFLLSYLAYAELDSCDLDFKFLSPITVVVSLIPPMFYAFVERESRMRSYISTIHLLATLVAVLFNSMFFAETIYLDQLCNVANSNAYSYQLVSVLCLHLGIVAGHMIGRRMKYEPLERIDI